MICPNCGAQSPTDDCIKCGVIISKHIILENKHHEPDETQPPKKKLEIYVEEKPSPTKAIILNILFLLTCLIVYIIYCPFLTVNNLKSAVEQQDSALMSKYMDYETLRESFKTQYDAKVIEGLSKAEGNPIASLAVNYVSKLTDPMVEEAMSPEGLTKIMTGYKKFRSKGDAKLAEVSPAEERAMSGILLEARKSYESLNAFTISIYTEKGSETVLHLKRTGIFSWKLDHIILAAE